MIKQNLTTILIVIVAVLMTAIIMSTCSKSPKPIDNREEIKLVREERDYYRGKYDSVISQARERDTLLIMQTIQQKTNYEKIRPTVESYNNNELLRRANEWRPY